MSTLDEIRLWAKGAEVKGLPERDDEKHRNVLPNPFEPIKYVCKSCLALVPEKYSCSDCDGLGYATFPAGKMCSKCQGSGFWSGEKCDACDGVGWVPIRKKTDKKEYKTSGRFKLSASGDDAILFFGKYSGKKVSEIDDGYLRWIIEDKFDERLKDVCRHVLKNGAKRKRKRKRKRK